MTLKELLLMMRRGDILNFRRGFFQATMNPLTFQ